jgi:hypothetical protein
MLWYALFDELWLVVHNGVFHNGAECVLARWASRQGQTNLAVSVRRQLQAAVEATIRVMQTWAMFVATITP